MRLVLDCVVHVTLLLPRCTLLRARLVTHPLVRCLPCGGPTLAMRTRCKTRLGVPLSLDDLEHPVDTHSLFRLIRTRLPRRRHLDPANHAISQAPSAKLAKLAALAGEEAKIARVLLAQDARRRRPRGGRAGGPAPGVLRRSPGSPLNVAVIHKDVDFPTALLLLLLDVGSPRVFVLSDQCQPVLGRLDILLPTLYAGFVHTRVAGAIEVECNIVLEHKSLLVLVLDSLAVLALGFGESGVKTRL